MVFEAGLCGHFHVMFSLTQAAFPTRFGWTWPGPTSRGRYNVEVVLTLNITLEKKDNFKTSKEGIGP